MDGNGLCLDPQNLFPFLDVPWVGSQRQCWFVCLAQCPISLNHLSLTLSVTLGRSPTVKVHISDVVCPCMVPISALLWRDHPGLFPAVSVHGRPIVAQTQLTSTVKQPPFWTSPISGVHFVHIPSQGKSLLLISISEKLK